MSAIRAGPRVHRPRQDRQVRRLLPRPLRRAAGQGRLRRAHARRCPTAPASPAAPRPDTLLVALQRPADARRACSPSAGRQIAGVIVEPVAGNMGCRPAAAAASSKACASSCDQARRRADLRRGHDRLPRRLRRRAGALRHHARPDHPRQDHRRRPAGRRLRRPRARSWRRWRPLGPRLPGRHPLGQPAGHGRRHRDPATARRRRARTNASKSAAPRSRAGACASGRRARECP